MEYYNSEVQHIIDEVIHDKIIRDMLKDRLIDGLPYKELEKKYGFSRRHTQRIIYKYQEIVFKHVKP